MSEIDLRKELNNFLEGFGGDISKQHTLLLRKARLDANGDVIVCACVSSLYKESDRLSQCPYCLGEGFIWDETFIYGYEIEFDGKSSLADQLVGFKPGNVKSYQKVFYIKYSVPITENDKIVTLTLNKSGKFDKYTKRKAVYRIETLLELRADYGRVEYYALYCNQYSALENK